jgi:hypothetical protein
MKHSLLTALALAALAGSLSATPSGLNNIPTADVTPMGVFVLQPFTDFGNGRDADLTLGFKTGLELWGQKFELGAVSPLAPDGGPVGAHFKYQVPELWTGGHIGLGVANVQFSESNRDRGGDPFSYAVVSQELGAGWRAHAGYGFQTHNNSVLLGVDKTVKLFNRDLVLRSDFIQIDDEDQWKGSFGFLYAIHKNFVLETWASQPLDHGQADFVVKLNFVFAFNDGAPPAPVSAKTVQSVK